MNVTATDFYSLIQWRHSLTALICLILLACSHVLAAQQGLGAATATVTLDLREAPVGPVLRSLFVGRNFSVDSNVRGTVTAVCYSVPFDQALVKVMTATSPPMTLSVENSAHGVHTSSVYHISQRPALLTHIPPAATVQDTAGSVSHAQAPIAGPPSDGTPYLTELQAIQAASVFCRKIGQTITVPGHVVLTAPDSPPLRYWQPCLTVKFPHQATVQVAEVGGIIAGYQDDTTRSQIKSDQESSKTLVVRMTMPQSDAISRAKNALEATGQPEGAIFESAGMSDLRYWNVYWDRTYHGIPYRDATVSQAENVGIQMDTRTGRIRNIIFFYLSPPVLQNIIKVSRGQAVRAAQEYLHDKLHLQARTVIEDTALCIISQAGSTDGAIASSGQTAISRPVWVVRLRVNATGEKTVLNTWVDTETGRITAVKPHFPINHFGRPNTVRASPDYSSAHFHSGMPSR